jgi:hypothetical protein
MGVGMSDEFNSLGKVGGGLNLKWVGLNSSEWG